MQATKHGVRRIIEMPRISGSKLERKCEKVGVVAIWGPEDRSTCIVLKATSVVLAVGDGLGDDLDTG